MAGKRRPFYFYGPYTPKDFERFRAAIIYAARKHVHDPEALFDSKWPEIRAVAVRCCQQLKIHEHLHDETTYPGSPLDKERRRVRGLRANRFRYLREAAKRGDVQWLVENYPDEIDGLLYGAMCAGVIKPNLENQHYDAEIKQLCRLDASDLKAAVDAVTDPASVLTDSHSRPSKEPIDAYVRHLADVFFTKKNRTAVPHGPAGIRAIQAAIAPFLYLSDHGIRKLIRRANSRLVEEKGQEIHP